MNEIAYYTKQLDEQEFCTWCGEPCGPDECDSDGNPIHNGENPEKLDCIADREASRIDAAHDREMMK